MAKPDAKYMLALRQHLTEVWAQAHTQWRTVDSYYHRTYALWPEGSERPSYHPSKSTNIIDHATDQFLSFTPIVHKPPSGKGESHKEEADRIEPAVRALMVEASLKEPTLTWKQVGKHLALYGYAVVEGPVLSMDTKPREPEQTDGEDATAFERRLMEYHEDRRAWMPVRIRAPHPARVLLDPLQKEPEEAIKVVKRYAKEIAALTQKKGRRAAQQWQVKDNPFELILTTEYWSREWHALFATDGLLYVEANTWRIMPFKHAFSGAGQELTDQDQVDPSYLAVSILAPVMESLKLKAQAASGRHNALLEATFPVRATTEDTGEVSAQYAQGDIRQAAHKGDVWWEEVPQLPAWIFSSEADLDRDIEEGTYSRALTGLREPGVSTVGQQTILSVAASRKFASIVEQQQQLASLVAKDILRLVKVLDEPITVSGYKLDPDDIHDYAISVTFELKDPVLQLQQKQMAMQEHAAELLSRETYWNTAAQLEDATGEHKRILIEKLERMPEAQVLLMIGAAAQEGLFDLVDALWQKIGGGRPPATGQSISQPPSSILGPDGQPLASTLGTGQFTEQVNAPQGAMDALRRALLSRTGMTPTIPSGNGRIQIPPEGI